MSEQEKEKVLEAFEKRMDEDQPLDTWLKSHLNAPPRGDNT